MDILWNEELAEQVLASKKHGWGDVVDVVLDNRTELMLLLAESDRLLAWQPEHPLDGILQKGK